MPEKCLIGKGCEFNFVPTVVTTIAPNQTVVFNQHFQNNTKCEIDERCRCEKEFFIFNHLNTDKIVLKKRGRYTFDVTVETTPAINTVVAIIDESNEAKIPLFTGTNGTVSMTVPEIGSIVRLKNVGTVPIVLTPGADTSVPLVIVTITYEGI